MVTAFIAQRITLFDNKEEKPIVMLL
jgi:hypothetical protein